MVESYAALNANALAAYFLLNAKVVPPSFPSMISLTSSY
jgi:hypothetical protein